MLGKILVLTLSLGSLPASAQALKIEGGLPSVIGVSASVTYLPGVRSDELSILKRKKCFGFNSIDLGEGRNWQWIPKSIQTRVQDTSRGNGYLLALPLSVSEAPECKWQITGIALEIDSKRTKYLPKVLYFKKYNPSNPKHRRVSLDQTRIICSLERDLEVCRVSPQHVEGDEQTMLLHENLQRTFRIDIELR